jgi:PTS system nitrogen regulatory IIA component
MNELPDLISIEAVEAGFPAANKKALLQHLAGIASRATGIPVKTVLAALNAREKLGSTGFGAGTAIPHAKLAGLDKVRGFFVRLAAPIDYQSVDGLPVDLVVLLLSPPDAGAEHLKALARVSRALRDRQVLAKLRGARSKDAIYALLAGEEKRDAA